MEWKVPPKIKVLEALGSIADGRIKFISDNEARVISSSGDKEYTVKFDISTKRISSTDNGSVYKGYLGYPSIAVLMLKDVLPFSEKIANVLKGIEWKKLNEKYKAYWKTEFVVKKIAEKKGVTTEEIDAFTKRVIEEIKKQHFSKLEE
ncbi:MAG: hypothetical protein J7L47_08905 [Candidatus Odinarchaeota archaeon]|nr:hypothetical protein [Candidatus Odinarchaeota archaeon]